jgi:hypothetical protein
MERETASPWTRFFAIVSIFSFAGPIFGTLFALMSMSIVSPGKGGSLQELAFIFAISLVAGYVVGGAFASATGVIFAVMALRFGKAGYFDACIASLIAQALIMATVTLISSPGAESYPNLGAVTYLGWIFVPSLAGAALCRRLSRRWTSPDPHGAWMAGAAS